MNIADFEPKFNWPKKCKGTPLHRKPKDDTVWQRDRKAAFNQTERREPSDPFAKYRALRRIDLGLSEPRQLRNELEAL
jgi:hypothetical protein